MHNDHAGSSLRSTVTPFAAALAMLMLGCGVEAPEETESVELALTNIDSRCVSHKNTGVTTCVRLQKEASQKVRAYGAVSGPGSVRVDGAQLYWWVNGEWRLAAASGEVKGSGHAASATAFLGPFPCGERILACATLAWSGQPGYRMCEPYTACAGE
jgi:hypothetical protein